MLVRSSSVVLHMMDFGMILKRFQMGRDLRWHFQIHHQALFEHGRLPMCIAHGHGVRKQEMDLDDLAISCRAEAHPVIAQPHNHMVRLPPRTVVYATIAVRFVLLFTAASA